MNETKNLIGNVEAVSFKTNAVKIEGKDWYKTTEKTLPFLKQFQKGDNIEYNLNDKLELVFMRKTNPQKVVEEYVQAGIVLNQSDRILKQVIFKKVCDLVCRMSVDLHEKEYEDVYKEILDETDVLFQLMKSRGF